VAPAAFRPYRRPALIERRIATVLGAVPRVDRAPASAGPCRLAPLRARPALGVSVGEQQSHYCATEQNKTDRAHDGPPRSYGVSHFNDFEALRSEVEALDARKQMSVPPPLTTSTFRRCADG